MEVPTTAGGWGHVGTAVGSDQSDRDTTPEVRLAMQHRVWEDCFRARHQQSGIPLAVTTRTTC